MDDNVTAIIAVNGVEVFSKLINSRNLCYDSLYAKDVLESCEDRRVLFDVEYKEVTTMIDFLDDKSIMFVDKTMIRLSEKYQFYHKLKEITKQLDFARCDILQVIRAMITCKIDPYKTDGYDDDDLLMKESIRTLQRELFELICTDEEVRGEYITQVPITLYKHMLLTYDYIDKTDRVVILMDNLHDKGNVADVLEIADLIDLSKISETMKLHMNKFQCLYTNAEVSKIIMSQMCSISSNKPNIVVDKDIIFSKIELQRIFDTYEDKVFTVYRLAMVEITLCINDALLYIAVCRAKNNRLYSSLNNAYSARIESKVKFMFKSETILEETKCSVFDGRDDEADQYFDNKIVCNFISDDSKYADDYLVLKLSIGITI